MAKKLQKQDCSVLETSQTSSVAWLDYQWQE